MDSSGVVLQGAQVQLQGNELAVPSNAQGEFALPDLPPGNYKLQVSYVGFQTLREGDHCQAAGETQRVDVALNVASANEEVLVTAERPRGEAEAINRTRMADNVLQVLPAEVITSLPNANVADALGRLPSVTLERIEGEGVYIQVRGTEPRLTNVTIDGITVPSPEPTVRQVRLDVIPADLVESVEINKTLAPNMDGDGIGGSVNMKTKTAGEFPTFSLYGIGGYNPILGGRDNDQFGGTIGHRFGKKQKLGILFGGILRLQRPRHRQLAAGHRSGVHVRQARSTTTTPSANIAIIAIAGAIAGTADYKFGDFSSIYLRGLYSNLQDYGDKWYYEPVVDQRPKFYTSSKRPDASISSYTAWAAEAIRSVEIHLGSFRVALL